MRMVGCTMYDFNGRPIKNVFGDLNKYLARKTSSRDPEINFNIAQDLYDSDGDGNSKLALAQRLFLSMKYIDDENICSLDSFNALYHVDLALSERTRDNLNRRIPCGRIQAIYFKLVEKHIKQCYPKYSSTLAGELSVMSEEKINYVKTFFDEAIDKYINQRYSKKNSISNWRKQVDYSTAEKLYKIIDGGVFIHEINDGQYILGKLQQLAKTDPADRIGTIETSKQERCVILYNHYLNEPCKYYREKLGGLVFEPAEFDHRFLSNCDRRNPNFYRFWVYYKLCSVISVDIEQICKN